MNTENSNRKNTDEVPEVIRKAGKGNPFVVPEGYFETLPERILTIIDELPAEPKKGKLAYIFSSRVRAIAASVAILLFAGFTYALITEVIIPAIRPDTTPPTEEIADTKEKSAVEDGLATGDTPDTSTDQDIATHAKQDLFPSVISAGRSDRTPLTRTDSDPTADISATRIFQQGIITTTPMLPDRTVSSAYPATPSTHGRYAGLSDTTVCRGTTLTYRTGHDLSTFELRWSVNGAQSNAYNTSSFTLNTANLSYGTHQLSLVVQDAKTRNIISVTNASVTVVEAPYIRAEKNICAYDKTVLRAGNRNPHWEYQWSTGEKVPEISVITSGRYWVSIRVRGGNCLVTDTFDVTIMPKPNLNLGSDRTVCNGDPVRFSIDNPTGQYKIRWTPGNVESSEYIFREDKPGIYRIRAELTACKTISDEVVIRVTDCRIEIPNIFTPNADGINDIFFIKGLDRYTGSRLIVTDRNGQTVYESNDYRNDWDGNGVPNGTYFYILYPGGSQEAARRGSVMILR